MCSDDGVAARGGVVSTGTALTAHRSSFVVRRSSFFLRYASHDAFVCCTLRISGCDWRFCFLFVSLFHGQPNRRGAAARPRQSRGLGTRFSLSLYLSLSLALLSSFVVYRWRHVGVVGRFSIVPSSRATCTYLNFFAQVLPHISFVPAVRAFSSSLF